VVATHDSELLHNYKYPVLRMEDSQLVSHGDGHD
jgi:ABC-type ATPase involved in cell division